MEFLRTNGFKTYIVTGGGQEFVRVYAYGIPPEQVVGSSVLAKYEYRDGRPGFDARTESIFRRRPLLQAYRDELAYRQTA
jgi:hypothetical protein